MAIVIIRTFIVFVIVIMTLRIMGKRQLGELELNELVVAVLISDIAAHPLQDIGIPIMNGLLPAVVLLCCELLISRLALKSARARKIIAGTPSILVENGRIIRSEMMKNRFTLDELAEELRNQSIIDISKIQYAILETDGRLNTILYPSEAPVTASQLNINVPDNGYPVIVINDGELLSHNLKKAGKNEKWLEAELKRRGAKGVGEVYILSVDGAGNIYYEPKDEPKK